MAFMEEAKNLSPETGQLIAENAALKARVAQLEEVRDGYIALVEEYDRELNASTDELNKSADVLKNAMAPTWTREA
jgi:hypothetical protein